MQKEKNSVKLSTYFWSAISWSAHDFGLFFRSLELCVYARYSGGVVGVTRRLDGVKVSDADLVAILQRDAGAEGEGVALGGAVGGDEDVARCVREGRGERGEGRGERETSTAVNTNV